MIGARHIVVAIAAIAGAGAGELAPDLGALVEHGGAGVTVALLYFALRKIDQLHDLVGELRDQVLGHDNRINDLEAARRRRWQR